LAAGSQLPESVFRLWTTLLTLEVNQENYFPNTVNEKKNALTILEESGQKELELRQNTLKKVENLTVKGTDRPATAEEKEAYLRFLRQRAIVNHHAP
jgi:hypothetical protein